MSQLVSQSVRRRVCKSVSQSASQAVSQSISQSVSQSLIIHSVSQSISQSNSHLITRTFTKFAAACFLNSCMARLFLVLSRATSFQQTNTLRKKVPINLLGLFVSCTSESHDCTFSKVLCFPFFIPSNNVVFVRPSC